MTRVLASARRHAPDARILGVLVQPMAPPGREVILGIKRDATFGPMLMVGLGGVAGRDAQGRGAGARATGEPARRASCSPA